MLEDKNTECFLIDILMGTFNGLKFIDDQIKSLQAQTHSNWILHIRDDGSTDKTIEYIKNTWANDPRINLIEDNKGRLGFNGNFFSLLEGSKSKYVMFCDQDDFWCEDKIELTLKSMLNGESSSPNLPILVHCESLVCDSSLNSLGVGFVGGRARASGLEAVLMANPAQGSTIMLNDALRTLVVRKSPILPYDYHCALIAEATGRRIFLPKPLMLYRQHSSNAIGAGNDLGPSNKCASVKSSSIRLGLDAAPFILATLTGVRDFWRPGVSSILGRHSKFLQKPPSCGKLFMCLRADYKFYGRKDIFYLMLYSIGFLNI
jgi:glycosyltransferase involved in cell wall biosynthesis